MEDENSIDKLEMEKENEVNEIIDLNIKALHNQIKEKDDLYKLLEWKYNELWNDYEYDVTVIKERDNDIKELTENIIKLTSKLDEKNNILHNEISKIREDYENELIDFKREQKELFENIQHMHL